MLKAIEETIMQNILEKNKPEENKQSKQPRTVIAPKLRRTIETIDRDGNVISKEIIEP